MKPLLAAALMAFSMSGCVTAEEMAAQNAAERTAWANADDQTCKSYGAEYGSYAYYQCRQTQQQNRLLVVMMATSAR